MDTFEHNELDPETEPQQPLSEPQAEVPEETPEEPVISQPQEPAPQPEPEPQPAPQPDPTVYRGVGSGRKESPYANSPYVMNHQPQQENRTYSSYQYQPQTPPAHQPEAPKKPRAKKQKRPIWKGIIAAVLVVALVASGCLITAYSVNEYWEERNEDTVEYLTGKISELQDQINVISGRTAGNSVSGSPAAVGDGLTPSQVYAQCVNSVVAISSTVQTSMYGQVAEATSTGSGFILTENGYVITNYHVVEGATSVDVITIDGTAYLAKIVGYDSTNDVALLKVEAEGLPAATLGSSSDLIIGDMVVAIGNPLGELTSTQTVGYVSGIGREVSTDGATTIQMIQTDAAINPGNSGGPLFNMKGEVVGITTAKYSGTTTSGASIEGIGFAIPIDDVTGILSDLMDYGYVTGAYLGVTVQNTDTEATAMFGLPNGAQVKEVVAGVSADRAGVKVNDIIIALGDYEVTNITTLTRALRNFKAGDTTTITVVRSGQQLVLDITLDEKPQNFSSTVTPEQDSSMPSEGSYEEWYEWFFGNGSGNGG